MYAIKSHCRDGPTTACLADLTSTARPWSGYTRFLLRMQEDGSWNSTTFTDYYESYCEKRIKERLDVSGYRVAIP